MINQWKFHFGNYSNVSKGRMVMPGDMLIRFSLFLFRQVDDLEIWTHTNETLGSVKRQVLQRMKSSSPNVKLEVFLNGDPIGPVDDRKIISHLPIKDKTLLSAKITTVGSGGQAPASSPDSR